jgi:hypothetical protein
MRAPVPPSAIAAFTAHVAWTMIPAVEERLLTKASRGWLTAELRLWLIYDLIDPLIVIGWAETGSDMADIALRQIAAWKATEPAAIATAIRKLELARIEREEEIAHDHALAIEMWPQLADEPFFTMHGWVFCGIDLGEPKPAPTPKPATWDEVFKQRRGPP